MALETGLKTVTLRGGTALQPSRLRDGLKQDKLRTRTHIFLRRRLQMSFSFKMM